jgi:thiamine pyrophosphokinase
LNAQRPTECRPNSAPVSRFRQLCPENSQVTLIGPLLEVCPTWPDGPIIFVDGGARWQALLPEYFRPPTLSLGDGDSLGNRQLDVLLDTEKDFSDLDGAFEVLDTISLQKLTLLGFLGGRRDHEWINFGVVANFLQSHSQLRADFDNAVSLLAPGQHTLNHRGLFSLVHFQQAHTKITGQVKYPLKRATPVSAHSSFGLSNIADGTFHISSDAVTMCFFNTD